MRAALILALGGSLAAVMAAAASPPQSARHVSIKATRYVYIPNRVVLKKGEPVVLDLMALDRIHGFQIADLHIRSDVLPGQVTEIRLTPDRAGVFPFHCDNFCGSGHEGMEAEIVVED